MPYPSLVSGASSAALEWRYHVACLVMLAATVGAVAGHAEQPPAPAVAAPGAPLDPSRFRYQRPLAPGDPGLVTLPLDAAALAHSQGPSRSFADVRVVDANNAQVPYLLERRDERLSLDLELRPATPQTPALLDRPGNRFVLRDHAAIRESSRSRRRAADLRNGLPASRATRRRTPARPPPARGRIRAARAGSLGA